MAERRMFSRKIINSDRFTELPFSAQTLYFHLGMEADDDGLLNNANRIRRVICAGEADVQLLEKNGYIIIFESGIVAIRHWKIHNLIKGDRYNPGIFVSEKERLLLEDNVYTVI